MNKKVFGWFEGHEETPSYDPGMEGLCRMMAYLLDEGILFAVPACAKYDGDKECVGLFINVNDYFIPASDSEAVTYDELPKLYEMYKEKKYDGVSQFVADKRGIPNVYWKDEGSNFRKPSK